MPKQREQFIFPNVRKQEGSDREQSRAIVLGSLATEYALSPESEADFRRQTARKRALIGYQAMRASLLASHSPLYKDSRMRTLSRFTHLWPYANAFHATCTLASMPEAPDLQADCHDRGLGLLAYQTWKDSDGEKGLSSRVVTRLGLRGDRYYDDNNWASLGLVQLFEQSSDPKWLELAEGILSFVQSGWVSDQSLPHPGGVLWAQPKRYTTRNTVSTAPAAELATRLYQITGKEAYLNWAIQCHDWVVNTMATNEGLYMDSIDEDGSYDRTIWSYNQGTMIGAGVLLHQATGEERFINQARQTAVAAVEHFSQNDILYRQSNAFNAIFFRNLFMLENDTPTTARSLATTFCERQWNNRDQASDLYHPVWDINATAPMVEIEALLAGSPARP